jgi:hypothetical protein
MQDSADPHARDGALTVVRRETPFSVSPTGCQGRAGLDRRHLPGSARPIAARLLPPWSYAVLGPAVRGRVLARRWRD